MRDDHLAAAVAGLLMLSIQVSAEAAPFRTTLSRSSPALTGEDTRMLEAAIGKALEEHKEGAVTSWDNSASGRAGQATVTKVYARGTQPCGMIEHIFTKGGGQQYELPYCHQADGSWKIQY